MKKILLTLTFIALAISAYLAGQLSVKGKLGGAGEPHRILYYVDPMHPSYRSDKPGTAPDCGMELEPVYAGEATSLGATRSAMPDGAVEIDLDQQQLIGIRTVEVTKGGGIYHIEAPGRVVLDDTRTYRLTAGIDGIVLSTNDHSVGSLVKKDEVLAVFSSPEFLSSESSFLVAWNRAPENTFEAYSPKEWKDQTLMLAASRLRALGMAETQLKQLIATKKVADSIEIDAPVDGMIVARSITAGQRVDRGAEFYRVADLSRVWILASLPEDEGSTLRPGAQVNISIPNQKRRWTARVSNAVPQFDPVTRAVQVRLEVDNPGLILRPDMFVNVDLDSRMPASLTIPVEALLDSGVNKVVYIDRGEGVFEPRQVQTGRRSGDRVEIVSGVSIGEKIVVSGTFLLDSESRLRFPQHTIASTKPADIGELPKSATDPACGMDVNAAESLAAGNIESYNGKTYYFCSQSCRYKFHRDPSAVLAHAGKQNRAGMPMSEARSASHD